MAANAICGASRREPLALFVWLHPIVHGAAGPVLVPRPVRLHLQLCHHMGHYSRLRRAHLITSPLSDGTSCNANAEQEHHCTCPTARLVEVQGYVGVGHSSEPAVSALKWTSSTVSAPMAPLRRSPLTAHPHPHPIIKGIYVQIAVPLKSGAWRDTSIVMMAQAMAARRCADVAAQGACAAWSRDSAEAEDGGCGEHAIVAAKSLSTMQATGRLSSRAGRQDAACCAPLLAAPLG